MINRSKQLEDCKAELLRFVADLHQPYGFERSFKLIQGHIYKQRFLISLHTDAFKGLALPKLQILARLLHMPKKMMAAIREELSVVEIVHFGFEQQQSTAVCKFYFERTFIQVNGPKQLVHRSFKWDVFSPDKSMVAEYHFLPGLSRDDMIARIASSCGKQHKHPITEVAKQLLNFGGGDLPMDDVFFLEVQEEGNARRSFDIKLYDTDLTIGQVGPVIESAAKYFNVPLGEIKELIKIEFEQQLGHFSGGIGRDAKEFVSFYYGVESR